MDSHPAVVAHLEEIFERDFKPEDDQLDYMKKRLQSKEFKKSSRILNKMKKKQTKKCKHFQP